jgi:hypothetical protein
VSNPNISALISAAETRESNVTAVIELLSDLPQPERVEVLVAALLRTSRVAVGISFGPPHGGVVPARNPLPADADTGVNAKGQPGRVIQPAQKARNPRRADLPAALAFADEPVAAPAPRLPKPLPNPSKARPTSRKGSGQEATRMLPKEDAGRLVELVEKHPGSSSPWLAKQLDVNPAGQRWRNTLQAALETGVLRKEGKDNKTRYFKGHNSGPG